MPTSPTIYVIQRFKYEEWISSVKKIDRIDLYSLVVTMITYIDTWKWSTMLDIIKYVCLPPPPPKKKKKVQWCKENLQLFWLWLTETTSNSWEIPQREVLQISLIFIYNSSFHKQINNKITSMKNRVLCMGKVLQRHWSVEALRKSSIRFSSKLLIHM